MYLLNMQNVNYNLIVLEKDTIFAYSPRGNENIVFKDYNLFINWLVDNKPTVISFWDNSIINIESIKTKISDDNKKLFDNILSKISIIDYSDLYETRFCNVSKPFSYYLDDLIEETDISCVKKSSIEKFILFDSKQNCINLMQELCDLCNVDIMNYSNNSIFLESFLKKEYGKDVSFRNGIEDETESILGGFSYSIVGNHIGNIGMFDFKSFYPSIIRTLNISNETRSISGFNTAIDNVKFSNKKDGKIPLLLHKLADLRDNSETNELLYKLLSNSLYGCFGYKSSILYSPDIANAITNTAQKIIKASILFANEYFKKKYEIENACIFCYTDSLFLKMPENFDAIAFTRTLNLFIKKFLTKFNVTENNYVEISFKGYAKQCAIFNKSNYVLINEDNSLKASGTILKSSEYSIFQKNIHEKLIKEYFNSGDITELLEKEKSEYLKLKYENAFCVRRNIKSSKFDFAKVSSNYNIILSYLNFDQVNFEGKDKLKFTYIVSKDENTNVISFDKSIDKRLLLYMDLDKEKSFKEFIEKPVLELIERIKSL